MRLRTFVTAKIHRATVTDANVDYAGSVAICPELLEAAGITGFELVHVNNVDTGAHWETYVIPGKLHEVTLHGPPAHLFRPGQRVVINRLELVTDDELVGLAQTVVFVDANNHIVRIQTGRASHHVVNP